MTPAPLQHTHKACNNEVKAAESRGDKSIAIIDKDAKKAKKGSKKVKVLSPRKGTR